MGRSVTRRSLHSKVMAGMLGIALCAVFGHVSPAGATAGAKIQGKIVGADTGEPVGFAEVVLLPQDSTLHPVGGLTNSDGTYLLEAPPGRYALKLRALSYTQKRIDGIVLEAGKLLPYSTALTSEAIKNDKFEIVVDARAVQNNEASMLSARRKAVAVGDAVSAEQVRKSPDKDAAEVLRRVTGLSVADGKYVFVRGLGERYSSTEVDGVRIASPEQNKRVVPLDLLPASLLEDIVVQKTYTADRPGEFGGGDVQVHTKDFPGRRTWQFSTSQGTPPERRSRITGPTPRATPTCSASAPIRARSRTRCTRSPGTPNSSCAAPTAASATADPRSRGWRRRSTTSGRRGARGPSPTLGTRLLMATRSNCSAARWAESLP